MYIGTPRLTGVYYNGPKGIKSSSARDLRTDIEVPGTGYITSKDSIGKS